MTDSSKVQAIVEAVRLGSSQAARVQVTLSFPNAGNEHVLGFLARQFKNSIDVEFESIQAALPEASSKPRYDSEEPEGFFEDLPAPEETTMVVNGEEARVVRPGRRGRRNGSDAETPAETEPESTGNELADKLLSTIEDPDPSPEQAAPDADWANAAAEANAPVQAGA